MNKTRRIDIDFLRALSVLSVIIFHLDRSFFPLGYLGVDIFFIISGYLISKIIIKECNNNSFSFYNFYIRRVRRIIPVLLLVLITITILSSFLLLLSDLKSLSKSLLSSLGFFPNMYFWITGGYFGTNDELKPLLHLWSLGIEEQFYLFFPLIFYFILKKKFLKKIKIFVVLFFIIISYTLNLIFIQKGHFDPPFFLLPFRIWEFGFGVLISLLPKIEIKNQIKKSLIIIFSIILIVCNFYKIIPFIPHSTLLVAGCSILIYFGINKNDYFYKFINYKIIIFTGLISYSLYLWHWPIISLLKYLKLNDLSTFDLFLCFLLTYFFSILSWKLVEQTFLKSKNFKKLIYYISLSYLFLIILSLQILFNKNFPSRYEDLPNRLAEAVGSTYYCSINEYKQFGDTYACEINTKIKNKPEIVLFGNSHAHMYGWGLKKTLIKFEKKGLTIPLNSCLPTIDKNISMKCLKKANSYYKSIIENKDIKTVIIGLTWYSLNLIDEKGNRYISETDRNNSLIYLMDKLQSFNKEVYLIGPIPIPGYDIASISSRELALKKDSKKMLYSSREDFNNKYLASINFFKKKLKENFLESFDILCDKKNCNFIDLKGSNFSDSNHLSKYGSEKMADLFKILFQNNPKLK